MEQNTLRKQRELTDRLNRYRNEYYNYNNPSVSDEVYDRLFDELHKLEQETGIQMSNSPTVTVGYPVVGKLEKTAHKIPLLSLDKVKSSVDLCRFMGEHQVMIMLKLDGLIPIDGIVVTYNDIAFSKRCGRTGHHYKDGLAFKFEDELFKTTLRSIEWTPGRTGEIAPVAIFAPVEIEGCEVTRASLHNLSFIEDLELMPGNRILVSKRNMIIPHVEENMDRGGFNLEAAFPHQCPCCGQSTRIHETKGRDENGKERIIKTLFCDNAACETRKLKQFVHFVSKKAMNIEGLSEATLEKLIGRGWIHSYLDLYRLDQHRDEIIRMDGFGTKSWQRLWDAIQQSRNTTFERYVIAMDIPMIGNTASGVLCREFHGSLDEFRDAVYAGYDFRQLPDFGDTLHNNIHEWFCNEDNFCIWEELQMMMNIQKPAAANNQAVGQDTPFAGKTIVVTGKVEPYDDGAPYSFFFEEVTPRGTGICGGIILHGADNLQKAQYSVHT